MGCGEQGRKLLPGYFPKLCLQEEKGEQGEGEGEAGTVGGQAGDRSWAPGAHGSAGAAHSSLISSQTAAGAGHSPQLQPRGSGGCWAHLGVTVPGHSMEGWAAPRDGPGPFPVPKGWAAVGCRALMSPFLHCPSLERLRRDFLMAGGGFNPSACWLEAALQAWPLTSASQRGRTGVELHPCTPAGSVDTQGKDGFGATPCSWQHCDFSGPGPTHSFLGTGLP